MDELQEQGQILDDPLLNDIDVVNYVAKELGLSVFQLIYEKNSPVKPSSLITMNRKENGEFMPVLFIVLLDNETVGIISSSSDTIQPLEYNKLTSRIIEKIKEANHTIDFS